MIALDARMIRHTGIGTYIRGLLSGFTEGQLGRMMLVGDPGFLSEYPCRGLPSYEPIYGFREQISLPSLLKKTAPAVFHAPHYNIPLLYRGPLIVTVHDLIHVLFPRYSRHPLARFYASFFFRAICRRADRLLAVSENTRRDLIRFGASASQVEVVHPAVDEPIHMEEKETLGRLRKRELEAWALPRDGWAASGRRSSPPAPTCNAGPTS